MSVFDNVAARLKEAIPKRPDGTEIKAWGDAARAWNQMRKELTNALNRIEVLEGTAPPPDPTPEPPPPPPPPAKRYAPRAYNTAGGSDARFCMDAKWGVARQGAGFVDQEGIQYDEGGRDLGGRTKNIVPELKPANEMDDRAPCDPYVGPTGVRIGGADGYPPGSFLQ